MNANGILNDRSINAEAAGRIGTWFIQGPVVVRRWERACGADGEKAMVSGIRAMRRDAIGRSERR